MSEDKLSLKYICDTCDNYKCCTQTGPAVLFEEEVKKIRKYAKEKNLPNIDDYIEKTEFENFYLLIRSEEGCFYFNEGNCLIQETKPIDCLVYPLGFGDEGK